MTFDPNIWDQTNLARMGAASSSKKCRWCHLPKRCKWCVIFQKRANGVIFQKRARGGAAPHKGLIFKVLLLSVESVSHFEKNAMSELQLEKNKYSVISEEFRSMRI
jgi:hypothetical protein